MRKILIFLGLLFVMLSNIYAQKGRQAIGFGLSYGTEIESIGLGLKYQYNITNPIRLEPSLNYFIENDNVSMLDVLWGGVSNYILYLVLHFPIGCLIWAMDLI